MPEQDGGFFVRAYLWCKDTNRQKQRVKACASVRGFVHCFVGGFVHCDDRSAFDFIFQ